MCVVSIMTQIQMCEGRNFGCFEVVAQLKSPILSITLQHKKGKKKKKNLLNYCVYFSCRRCGGLAC